MYAGQVVEQASTHDLLIDPRHEYTRGLLGSVLSIEAGAERLHQVPGTVPSPRDFARGDRFAPRSVDPAADPTARPRLVRLDGSDHRVATTGAVPPAFTSLERSEEHTSELQSRGHLVCRLLLEKKNNNKTRE